MANFGTTEILIVLFVVLLLFGSAKLPQFARSLGRSARILKAETKGLYDDDDTAPEPHRSTVTRSPDETVRPAPPRPHALRPGQPLEGTPIPDPTRLPRN